MGFLKIRNPSWRSDLKYVLWFPLYLLIFLLLEQRPMEQYWATQIPLDTLIPFCEWFAIPYYLWYPFLIIVGVYLFLQDHAAFRRYMFFLAFSFFASELIWLLIPNGQDLRPPVLPRDNVLTRLMAGIYQIDTHTNVFPSVHVVGSIGAALAVGDTPLLRKHHILYVSSWILAILICLSVVFVKQHGVLDLLGGVLLAILFSIPVYRTTT